MFSISFFLTKKEADELELLSGPEWKKQPLLQTHQWLFVAPNPSPRGNAMCKTYQLYTSGSKRSGVQRDPSMKGCLTCWCSERASNSRRTGWNKHLYRNLLYTPVWLGHSNVCPWYLFVQPLWSISSKNWGTYSLSNPRYYGITIPSTLMNKWTKPWSLLKGPQIGVPVARSNPIQPTCL